MSEPLAERMQIRPYREADEDAVVALWYECGLTRPWNDPHLDIARKQQVQPDGFVVGTVDGKVVASMMVGYDGHRGSVNYLAVAPAYQGHGVGRALMAHAEAWLLARGCPKLNLLVRRSNHAVQAFYEKLDYKADDVICLGKRLIPDNPS